MLSANQALAWIIFKRDRKRFEELFPELIIERVQYLPWISYMAAGGVTRKSLAPRPLLPVLKAIDAVTTPLRPAGALMWHITIRKRVR
jgi:hypothetical protein